MKRVKHSLPLAAIVLFFCGGSRAQDPSPETQLEETATAGEAGWGDLGNGTFKNPFLLAD